MEMKNCANYSSISLRYLIYFHIKGEKYRENCNNATLFLPIRRVLAANKRCG